jgi:hypothetical protein
MNYMMQADTYTKKNKGIVSRHLSNIINDIKESDYWINSYNCSYNMTEAFTNRKFQYKEKVNDNIKASIMAKSNQPQNLELMKVIDKLNNLKKSDGYESSSNKTHGFTDALTALKSSAKRTYFPVVNIEDLIITKQSVTDIIKSITNERELFDIFNAFIVSKDYCHMVINNAEVLTIMQPLLAKYAPLYKYLLGYAWMSLYTEECISNKKTTKTNRFVFDIHTASQLPSYPFSQEDLHQNPYLAILVGDKSIDAKNNCLGLSMISKYNGYGIATLAEFKQRFNIFTTGNINKNVLDGLDWEAYAISGSIIPACLQKRPVLVDYLSNNGQSETDKWLRYFNHFYEKSDIDLMCNKESIFKFMDCVNDVTKLITKNLLIDHKEVKIEYELFKTLNISVNVLYVKEQLSQICEYIGKSWTYDQVIKNITTDTMKEYFYKLYCETKFEANKNYRKLYKSDDNPVYAEFYKLSTADQMNIILVTHEYGNDQYIKNDSQICFHINDFRSPDNKVSDKKNLMIFKISEGLRIKIKCDKMKHPIEIFRSIYHVFAHIILSTICICCRHVLRH